MFFLFLLAGVKRQGTTGRNATTCYNCLEKGHLSSNCTKKKELKCRQPGHMADKCPKKNIAMMLSEDTRAKLLREHEDQEGRIQDDDVNAMQEVSISIVSEFDRYILLILMHYLTPVVRLVLYADHLYLLRLLCYHYLIRCLKDWEVSGSLAMELLKVSSNLINRHITYHYTLYQLKFCLFHCYLVEIVCVYSI